MARSSWWLWSLPLSLLGGCLLPGFENVATPPEAEGGSESGGTGVTPVAGGGGEAPGSGGASGGAAGGEGPAPAEPQPVADTFILAQGKSLKLSAASGVLANDRGAQLSIVGYDDYDAGRPNAYDAELEIDADGSLSFTPTPSFFGRYHAEYTVTDVNEQNAVARVTFIVQPAAVNLEAVQDGVGGVVLTGDTLAELGASVVGVGDVNDDGFDDLAIGAPGEESGAGAVYVVFGSSGFVGLTLSSLASTSKETRYAVLAGSGAERVGAYVTAAGRYDSDQVPDILIGSPQAKPDGGNIGDGALYLAFGGAELKATTPLASLSQGRGLIIAGRPAYGQQLGLVVAGGGDYDGDAKIDLLAGFFEGGDATKGLALLLEPQAQGAAINQLPYKTVTDGAFELPKSLSFVGDVTGDGRDDILASSLQTIALLPGDGSGALPAALSDLPASFIVARPNGATLGAPVASAGDVNGDGKADLVYCDGAANAVACRIVFGDISAGRSLAEADWSASGFATTPALPFVTPGSDVNQDDLSDLLFADASAAYVVFGREAGFGGGVDVSDLGSAGFSLSAPPGGSLAAIASVGDVNGDGYNDFAASDPTAADGGGRVYVVFGGPFAADQR